MGTAIGLAVVGGALKMGGAAVGAAEESNLANKRNEALETEKRQVQLSEKERSVKRLDNLKNIIDSNLATAAFRGVNPASASFKAISRKSFDQFNEDENLDQLNTLYKEQFITQQQAAGTEEAGAKEAGGFFKAIGDIL